MMPKMLKYLTEQEVLKVGDIKKGDYIVLTTKKDMVYAGENLGESEINGKKGLLVSLHKQNLLVIWCDLEYVKNIRVFLKNDKKKV